jgi:hypothetical protein
VRSIGGRFAWNDGGNTPNMQVASFDFGNDIPVLFEVRNLHNKQNDGQYQGGPSVGVVVTCEGGEFRGGRGGGSVFDTDGKMMKPFTGDAGATHMDRFVQAVRANDASMVRAPLETSFYSSCMSHLANISVRTGTPSHPDELDARIANDAATGEVIGRFSKQMDALDVDFGKNPWHVGNTLQFDASSERFVDGDSLAAANELLKRNYRVPHVIENVS